MNFSVNYFEISLNHQVKFHSLELELNNHISCIAEIEFLYNKYATMVSELQSHLSIPLTK